MKKYQVKVASVQVGTWEVEAENLLDAVVAPLQGQGNFRTSVSGGVLCEAGCHGILEVWEVDQAGDLCQVDSHDIFESGVTLKRPAEEDVLAGLELRVETLRAEAEKIDKPFQRAGALMALDEVTKVIKQAQADITNRIRAEADM